ncbi:unnamed protein product [Nesidiocoris tenuis]|uniref:Uncharacterized protein n=1 Tax=Nesidiocoris tenuis TaxID=355587 RepID=A0A6H5GP88_9HEMI|nr:unnamed protein product [Nesidiocoris tenuis]
MGLLFTGCDNTTQLETFSDADHGGDTTTGRSTSGVVSIFFQWRDIVAKPATGFSGNIYYRSRNRGCQRGCERNGLAEEVTQGHGSRQRKNLRCMWTTKQRYAWPKIQSFTAEPNTFSSDISLFVNWLPTNKSKY